MVKAERILFTTSALRAIRRLARMVVIISLSLTLPLSPLACLREAASAEAGEREGVRGYSALNG
jgi:hypothetical protein